MQKKIIALAIAGLASTAAFAADNVTLYGVVDAFAASVSGDTRLAGGSINSGGLSTSRIGFKGVEDLGNGLKAAFVLEYRLNVDGNYGIGGNTQSSVSGTSLVQSTSSSGPARQQMLALVSNAGTFAVGRLQTAGYDFGLKYDALAGSRVSAYGNLTTKQNLISGVGLAARANNAVAYISPSFGGVVLAANWSNNFDSEDLTQVGATRKHATLLSAAYDNGPISATFVYAAASAGQTGYTVAGGLVTAATPAGVLLKGTTQEWALGASYDFGVVKAMASYQRLTADTSADAMGAGFGGNHNVWNLGVTIPAGPGVVAIDYAQAKDSILNTALVDSKDYGAKSWSVGYIQPLSKRTKVYAAYSTVKNGSDTAAYFVDNQASTTANSVTGVGLNGGKSNILAAGINHSF